MPELIDKIELLKTIDEEINNAETRYEADIMFKIKDIVQKQDVFDLLKDLKPVKRGHWIKEKIDDDKSLLHGAIKEIKCSVCNKGGLTISLYCPNCGADMREENKNDP